MSGNGRELAPSELVEQTRMEIRFVLSLLVRPTAEAFGACASHFEKAVVSLGGAQRKMAVEPRRHSALRGELAALQTDLDRAYGLLRQAVEFQAGWSQIIVRDLGGYSRTGNPAGVPVHPV